MVDLEQEIRDELIGTVDLGKIFDSPRDPAKLNMQLHFILRHYGELKRRYPERNGKITLNYAINDWSRMNCPQTFNRLYSLWHGTVFSPDFVDRGYMEIVNGVTCNA